MTTIEQMEAIVRKRFATTTARVTATPSYVEITLEPEGSTLLLRIGRGQVQAVWVINLSATEPARGLGVMVACLGDLIQPLSALAASEGAGDGGGEAEPDADPQRTGPARTGAIVPLLVAAG